MNNEGFQKSDDTLVTCFFDDAAVPRVAGPNTPDSSVNRTCGVCAAETSVVLRIGSRRISLLAGDGFVVGRQRNCDIVPPLPRQGDETARRRFLKVSRRHCMLFRGNAGWCVKDGEGCRRSSFGTWWRGEPVEGVASIGIGPGVLSVGGPSAGDSVSFDVSSIGLSLVLSSRPDAKETHVLLCGEALLESVDACLSGLWIRFVDGKIRWRRGCETGILVPGTRVSGATSDFWVE
jgi:hypothetical protein